MGQIAAFDTNAFIYFLDEGSPFYQQSLTALGLLENADMSGVVSVLAVTEIRAGIRDPSSTSLLDEFGDKLQIVAINRTIAEKAGQLRQTIRSIRTPDALHLATALECGADYFITNDKDLAKLDVGIKIILLEKFDGSLQ